MRPELLVSRVFGVVRTQVDDGTSNATLPQWDSLAHVQLLIALEQEYGVALSPAEAVRATSVAAIKEVLECRGVRW